MRKTPKVSLTTKEYCLFFSIQQALSLKTCKQKNPYSLRSQISSSAAVSLLKKPEGDEKNVHEGKWSVFSGTAATSFNSGPSMQRHWACGVRERYLIIMSNRLPPLLSPSLPRSLLPFPFPSTLAFSLESFFLPFLERWHQKWDVPLYQNLLREIHGNHHLERAVLPLHL